MKSSVSSILPYTFVEEHTDPTLWVVNQITDRQKHPISTKYLHFEGMPKPIQKKIAILKVADPQVYIDDVGIKSIASTYVLYILS